MFSLANSLKEWVMSACSSENASVFGSEKCSDLSFFVEKSPSPVFLIFVFTGKKTQAKKVTGGNFPCTLKKMLQKTLNCSEMLQKTPNCS